MATRIRVRTLPDSYFALVRRFPLTCIRDQEHLAEASKVIDALLRQDLDEGGQAYLDVLTELVESFEDQHVPIADASEADVLRALMEANGLSQSRLARAVGISQSTLSAVLRGSRTLTKDQVVKLSRIFGVSPAAFLPA
jgi:HTH-type transcriptional regulator/antitoxin HigA